MKIFADISKENSKNDVWNAAAVLIVLPHEREQSELLPLSKPFIIVGKGQG